MNKTKIDYYDSTWNPITGCLHGCQYCYARGVAKRFAGLIELPFYEDVDPKSYYGYECDPEKEIYDVFRQQERRTKKGQIIKSAYPFGFAPTFHRYKLDECADKSGRTIFVCSMADLFGEWVPDEWICEVFKACEAAPQHRYLFLTKDSKRYLYLNNILGAYPTAKNIWLGASAETRIAAQCVSDDLDYLSYKGCNTFLSLEPLHEDVSMPTQFRYLRCVIIGAESGNRKDKVVPKREWIERIVERCRIADVSVFMKNNLAPIWGEPLIQELPWTK